MANNSKWHPSFSNFGAVPTEVQQTHSISEGLVDVDMEGADDVGETEEFDEDLDGGALELLFEGSTVDYASDGQEVASPSHFPPLPAEDIPFEGISGQGMILSREERDQIPSLKSSLERRKFADLPFSLLLTSEADIHLLRDIRYRQGRDESPRDLVYGLVVCQKATEQSLPPGLHNLGRSERLNMVAQVPELGIVLVGNQIGRVAILTMTRWESHKHSGFKIECILPFKSQEEKGLRPKKPLLGIAVGPIQGQESKPDPGGTQDCEGAARVARNPLRSARRYRLLMTYTDHTILGYEIWRSTFDDELLVF